MPGFFSNPHFSDHASKPMISHCHGKGFFAKAMAALALVLLPLAQGAMAKPHESGNSASASANPTSHFEIEHREEWSAIRNLEAEPRKGFANKSELFNDKAVELLAFPTAESDKKTAYGDDSASNANDGDAEADESTMRKLLGYKTIVAPAFELNVADKPISQSSSALSKDAKKKHPQGFSNRQTWDEGESRTYSMGFEMLATEAMRPSKALTLNGRRTILLDEGFDLRAGMPMPGFEISSMTASDSIDGGDAKPNKAVGGDPRDPYESFNRAMFKFNDSLDKAIITPVTRVWRKVVPSFVRKGVVNVFENFKDVVSLASNLLRLDFKRSSVDLARVLGNTVYGVGGIFNVADASGVPKNKNTFGDTLRTWGWEDSAYLVPPFGGPSTIRDTVGFFLSLGVMPEAQLGRAGAVPLAIGMGMKGLLYRDGLLDISDSLANSPMDKYSFFRNMYLGLKANESAREKAADGDGDHGLGGSQGGMDSQEDLSDLLNDPMSLEDGDGDNGAMDTKNSKDDNGASDGQQSQDDFENLDDLLLDPMGGGG